MEDGARTGPYIYDAFISYRHVERDQKWASWLIEALERYRIPKALRDKGYPARLGKIFRDEDETLASADLSDQLKEALEQSRFLIVICSAFTPRFRWVQREIEIFNELGRGDRVLALLTEGEPADAFPTPLLEHYHDTQVPDGSLQTVREEREPLAADVRPRKGWSQRRVKRFALLRLVACILGVAFDDLRRRDRERQRRWLLAWSAIAAIVCLLMGGGGVGYWDLTRAHVAYYRNLVWRWGIPEGLSVLDGDTRSHLWSDFRLITRRGRVVEVLNENNAGSLVDDEEGHARWVLTYGEDGQAEKIQLFDHADHPMGEEELRREPTGGLIVSFERSNIPKAQEALQNLIIDPLSEGATDSGGKSEITRHELAFDGRGFVSERRYQDSWGTPRRDGQGSFGQKFEYSPDGLVLHRAEIADDGREVTLKNGVRAVAFAYDRNGDRVRQTILGYNGQPIDGPDGYAYYTVERDHWGNDITTSYYASNGERALHKEGYSRFATVYDAHGDAIEATFYGIDDRPTVRKDGIARLTLAYDAHGNVIARAYFGTDGKPTLYKDGYARIAVAYDARGNVTEEAYFGTSSEPILSKDGFARATIAYDARGNPIEEARFGIDGRPILSKNGIARVTRAYDARGNRIEVANFGTDGKPILSKNGIARFTLVYDARGNVAEGSAFGIDGKPTPAMDGYAHFTKTYDTRSNLIEEAFFGIDAKPTLSNNGYARFNAAFDARGNRIEVMYFGTDGKPTSNKDEYARFTQAYDSRGNGIEIAYFGIDGQPTLSKNGYARFTDAYDSRGNLIEEAYFGIDGQPILSKDGVARLTRAYDARGNVTEEIGRGIDGDLILTGLVRNVPAHFKYDYDTRDRLIRTTYFDANDHEVVVEIMITHVDIGSPAEQLGLQADDRLLSYGGQQLTSAQQLVRLCSTQPLACAHTGAASSEKGSNGQGPSRPIGHPTGARAGSS